MWFSEHAHIQFGMECHHGASAMVVKSNGFDARLIAFLTCFKNQQGWNVWTFFLIFFGLTGCTLLLVECAKLDIWQTRHVRMFTVFLFVSSVCISAPGANGWRLKYDAKIWGHRKRMQAGIPSGIVMWTSLEHLGLLTRLMSTFLRLWVDFYNCILFPKKGRFLKWIVCVSFLYVHFWSVW